MYSVTQSFSIQTKRALIEKLYFIYIVTIVNVNIQGLILGFRFKDYIYCFDLCFVAFDLDSDFTLLLLTLLCCSNIFLLNYYYIKIEK
jgi:hypothetical protein